MPAEPSTTELLSEEVVEATTLPTLDDAELESLHEFKMVGAAEHPLTADGVRIASGVGSLGTAAP